jgi:uncharacterized membrane protein
LLELWILGGTLLVGGVTLIWVSMKQRAGTLRRNWFVGLRTWQTMGSDAAWHAAHGTTGGLVIAAGVVQVVAVLALVLLRPTDDGALMAVVLGAAGVTLALVLAAGIRGHILAARVDDEDRPSR